MQQIVSKPDFSAKMGQLLLQGYAMLEHVCPDCHVPIMRSRAKHELCVSCDQAYKTKVEDKSVKGINDWEKKVDSSH